MKPNGRGLDLTFLAGALGLLACACGSGGTAEAGDGGTGGSGGAAAGTKFGAVIVNNPGPTNYFASAAFSDSPRLLTSGEFTSLELGVGEPDGCTKNTSSGCQIFRCPGTITAMPRQATDPNVGRITITWSPNSGPGGDGLPPRVTIDPYTYDLFYWGTGTVVARFGFSAAGGAIPAFPPTDVDAPQPLEVTGLGGSPLGPSDPSVPRGAGASVTWTGGTADAVFVLEQRQVGSDNDLMAVCRVAASTGSFTFSSGVLGEFQPGNVSLRASVVSTKVVAAGDYATTLAIGVPSAFRFLLVLE